MVIETVTFSLAFVPIIVAAAIAATATLAAAGVGAAVSAKDRAEARRRRKEALEMYSSIALPEYADLENTLNDMNKEGLLDPKGHMAILELDALGRSKAGDPQAREAQQKALEHLRSVMSSEGLTDQDKSFYYKIADNIHREVSAASQAQLANMQARGVAGGGVELASIAANSQAIRQANARGAVDLAAVAMQRKDQAAQAAGQLGGQMQAQAFAEGQTIAQLSMQQRQQALQNVMAQEALRTQGFQNRLAQAAGATGQLNKMSDDAWARSQQVANQYAQVGQGIGKIATSVGGAATEMEVAKIKAGK